MDYKAQNEIEKIKRMMLAHLQKEQYEQIADLIMQDAAVLEAQEIINCAKP